MRQGRDVVAGFAYVVIVSVCAHLLFSSLGFNPTDDGFLLAFSRRILESQVPHRDFISVRPALSAFLWVPVVQFGGEYVFWLSRFFVLSQFALISWAWMLFISRLFDIHLSLTEKILASIVVFVTSLYKSSLIAQHTVDGIFFVSLGLLFWLKGSKTSCLVGYVLIGAAYLCKQSFFLLPVAALVVLGDWRHVRNWLAIAAPGILYLCYLGWNGAVLDALAQVLSPDGLFFSVGVWRYVTGYDFLWGVILGYAIIGFEWPVSSPTSSAKLRLLRLAQTLVVFLVLATDAVVLARGNTSHIFRLSFLLFGAVLGLALRLAFWSEKRCGAIRALAMVLVTAWSASLSNGCNAPVLVAGPLALCLLAYIRFRMDCLEEPAWPAKLSMVFQFLTSLLLIVGFVIARFNHIYRDLPAPALTKSLDGVLPGGKLIRTNPNTYDYLVDLHTAIDKADGRIYAILPDNAGFWVKHSHVNPLPADWADWLLPGRFGKPSQLARIVDALEAHRGHIVVIVQKVSARSLATGFKPLEKRYPIVDYVKSNFSKVDETKYFELYE